MLAMSGGESSDDAGDKGNEDEPFYDDDSMAAIEDLQVFQEFAESDEDTKIGSDAGDALDFGLPTG